MRVVQSQQRKVQLRKAPGLFSVCELISVKIIIAMKSSVRKESTSTIYLSISNLKQYPLPKLRTLADDFQK